MLAVATAAPSAMAAPPAGASGEAIGTLVAQAVARFDDLTIAAIAPGDPRRCAIWTGGDRIAPSVDLALFDMRPHAAASLVGSTSWSGAYAPMIRINPEWRYRGQPTASIILRHGAAAAEFDLYGLSSAKSPARLAHLEAADIERRTLTSGQSVIKLFDYGSTPALQRTCLTLRSGTLTHIACAVP